MLILSYRDMDQGRQLIDVEIRDSIILLPDGQTLDQASWVTMNYQVEKATEKEAAALEMMGVDLNPIVGSPYRFNNSITHYISYIIILNHQFLPPFQRYGIVSIYTMLIGDI